MVKLQCATFGLENGVERPSKRRDIPIMIEITEFSSKFECLCFANSRDRFDAEIAVLYVRRVEWNLRTV
jgi:hypothetical protein